MRSLLFAAAALFSSPALACYAAPSHQSMSGEAVLRLRGADVTLAKVVREVSRTSFGMVRYELQVQRRFSGPDRATFQLDGRESFASPRPQHHARTNSDFWSWTGGSAINDTDCEIYPSLSIGKTYLIFLEKPYTRKSFELIESQDDTGAPRDEWLQFGENHFNSRPLRNEQ